MAYSTIDDLKLFFDDRKLKQLTDDEGDGTQIDARLEAAIGRADEEIDGYLGGRYSVPLSLTPLPEMIKDISVDLAIVQLHKRRGDFLLDTKAVKARRTDALARLVNIQNGKITFTGTGEPNNSSVKTRDQVYTPSFINQF